MITYQDFQKVELKVGKVVAVEDHPNADKLLILRVDIGEPEPRTLVAGIRGHYTAAELQDKLVVVVSNLQPAKLRGVESNGMMLAAQQDGKIVVLSLDKPIAPGAKVL